MTHIWTFQSNANKIKLLKKTNRVVTKSRQKLWETSLLLVDARKVTYIVVFTHAFVSLHVEISCCRFLYVLNRDVVGCSQLTITNDKRFNLYLEIIISLFWEINTFKYSTKHTITTCIPWDVFSVCGNLASCALNRTGDKE